MAEELNFSNMWVCWIAIVGNATGCLADELNGDVLDLQACFDMDYALDKIVIGVNSTPA